MNYRLQSKKNKKRFTPLFVVGIFIVLVVGITLISPLFFGGISNGVGRPFWHSGGFLFDKVANLRAFTTSRHKLLEMNRALESELVDAKTRLLAFSVVEEENNALKKAWGRDETPHGVLASVLVKPPQSFYDTLILDIGENKQVVAGDKVVISDTVILGTIDEVFGKTSRAKLFSSVDTETLAIVDRNSLSVTLTGKGAGNFEIKVPQEVDILKGDTIILPGMTHSVVAEVLEIESVPSNSFKRIFCKVPINIAELRFVSVVK